MIYFSSRATVSEALPRVPGVVYDQEGRVVYTPVVAGEPRDTSDLPHFAERLAEELRINQAAENQANVSDGLVEITEAMGAEDVRGTDVVAEADWAERLLQTHHDEMRAMEARLATDTEVWDRRPEGQSDEDLHPPMSDLLQKWIRLGKISAETTVSAPLESTMVATYGSAGLPYAGYAGDPRNSSRRPLNGHAPVLAPPPIHVWYAGKPASGGSK